nr:NAD(P)-dependent oxidoreductase [Prauserella isguenensis]
MSGRRVVVLGGSGFVGSAVAARFLAEGARVRSVSRSGGNPVSGVDAVGADLTRPGVVAEAVAGADVVVVLVLYTGSGGYRVGPDRAREAAEVNVGVAEAVAAAARDRILLFAGSTSQVGVVDHDRIDGTETDAPVTEYDRQKCEAERVVSEAGGITLRLPTVYGCGPAGLDRGVVTAMTRRALAGEPLTVWGDGGMQRDLLHVDDVSRAFAAAAGGARQLTGRHWLLGSGAGVSVRELFVRVARVVARRSGAAPVPVVSVAPPAHATAMDMRGLVADPAAFRDSTGWEARVGLDDGIETTVAAVAGRTRQGGRYEYPYSAD